MPGSQPNKILFIPSWYPNRTEYASGNFIKRLIEADSAFDEVSVLFVCPDTTLQEEPELITSKENGFPEVIVYYPKVQDEIFGPFKKFRRRIKAYDLGMEEIKKQWGDPQLVHVQVAFPAIFYALRLYRKHDLPYILTEHSLNTYSLKFGITSYWFSSGFLHRAIEKAKKIITVSNYLAEAMRKNGIKNSFVVIPNVVPLPEALSNTKPPADKKRILHISTLVEVKNIKGILRAIKQVSVSRRDFELVIVGEQEKELKETVKYAKKLDIPEEVIKFRSYIKEPGDIAELILSSNFMLMFSYSETFSIVLAESLWAGRPVISSKCGGPQEFISQDSGILVEPGDEKALEQAIHKMLDTWQNYDAEKMKKSARDNFSPAVVGKKLHTLHSEILKSR